VPEHVYQTLEPYADKYQEVFGRPLAPQTEE
jgi:3,8-divinyl protochlorophyllide a 8-vinyl-reductase (ferredoxin)